MGDPPAEHLQNLLKTLRWDSWTHLMLHGILSSYTIERTTRIARRVSAIQWHDQIREKQCKSGFKGLFPLRLYHALRDGFFHLDHCPSYADMVASQWQEP